MEAIARLSRSLRNGVPWFASGVLLAMGVPVRSDVMPLPPPTEEFRSANGQYRLAIRSVDDGWKSRKSRAELHRVSGGQTKHLWTKELPHEYRPRTAYVGPGGEVLLLDEWINVMSRRALIYLRSAGEIGVRKSFEEIAVLLGVSASAIVTQARFGPWMSGPPVLSDDGTVVVVPTAGMKLAVDLRDGSLSVE